ncbi:MAG: hypothetical protein ABH956_03280 [Candidatus Nealsonbacteria bacterium]
MDIKKKKRSKQDFRSWANKGIATPFAILIIIISAVVLVGGVFAYNYYVDLNQKNDLTNLNIDLGNGGVEVSNKTDETEDWETYRNEEYRFEMKYPSTLSPKIESLPDDILSLGFENNNGILTSFFWLYAGSNDKEKIILIVNSGFPTNNEIISRSVVDINGLEWNIIEENNTNTKGIENVSTSKAYIEKGDFTYIIMCRDCNINIFGESAVERKEIFEQIVSNFKFIK